MSPRLAGSILALLATALLVVSIVTSAWWGGPPEVDGRTMHKKEVFVGLLGAKGCNTGGDGSCESLELPAAFSTTGYVALGASGLLGLSTLLLALMTLARSEARKQVSTLVFVMTVLAALAATALIVQGPKVMAGTRTITIPIGYGIYLFAGGLVAAVLGALLARRPAPKLELRGSRQPIAPNLAPPPTRPHPADVYALAPTAPPNDPRMQPAPLAAAAIPAPAPMSAPRQAAPGAALPGGGLPSGMLPGPAGPLGIGAAAPSYGGGQYRPLYEVDQAMGGTGGFVPPVPVASMMSPAPSAPIGLPAPPPPPPRRSPSAPPPISPAAAPRGAGPGAGARSAPPLPGMPPSAPRTKAASIVPPPRAKAPSLAPPARTKLPGVGPSPPKPTTIAAVAPPPGLLAAFKVPVRADTDPTDGLETVDRDAMTIARDAPDVQIGRPPTGGAISDGLGDGVGDRTDASLTLPPEEPGQRAETSADEGAADDDETAAREKAEPTDQQPTVARDSSTDVETIAHQRMSASELATGDSTEPVTEAAATAATEAAAPPRAASAPAGRAASAPRAESPAPGASHPKIPVSTAPDTLPPPSETEAASSGPTPACPQCEAPMGWVEAHLRFYCKTCRMYF